MGEDRAQAIIDGGDPREIIRMGLRSRRQAEEGIYCTCEEPILYGLDLMCGACLRQNQGQIERRTEAIRSPHPFQPSGDGPVKSQMCRLCAMWEDDPRHTEASPGESEGGE